MMNRRHLKLASLVLAVFMLACVGVKTIIATWDYAPTVIDGFNTSQENKDRLKDGSRLSGTAWRVYDVADKGTPEKKKLARNILITEQSRIIVKNFAPTHDAGIDAWVDRVLGIVRIWLGLPKDAPVDGADVQRMMQSDKEIVISDDDIKAFEKAMKEGVK